MPGAVLGDSSVYPAEFIENMRDYNAGVIILKMLVPEISGHS